MGVAEDLGVGGVAHLAVERHHVSPGRAQRSQGLPVGLAGGDRLTQLVARQLEVAALEGVGRSVAPGLGHLDPEVGVAAPQLLDGLLGLADGLAVGVVLVLHRAGPLALQGAGHDHRGLPGGGHRLGVGGVDGGHVVAVDGQGLPARSPGPLGVAVEVPAVHGLTGLAETVDVDDGGQVVEAGVGGMLEGLPHGALRHLAVAAEHPHPVGQAVEALAGQRHPHADGQALAEGAGGHVDPGQDGGGVTLVAAAEGAEAEQIVVGSHAHRLVEAVQQRRGVALGEDEMVVVGVGRIGEVVVEVLAGQHGHEVGGRHRRRRVTRVRPRRRPHRVDSQLLTELLPLLLVVHPQPSLPGCPRMALTLSRPPTGVLSRRRRGTHQVRRRARPTR